MQRFLGVDIGNSGLRVAELDLVAGDLGEMLRIDWCFADLSGPQGCTGDKERFLPHDAGWVERLKRFAQPYAASETSWLISSVRQDAFNVLNGYLDSIAAAVQVVTYRDLPLEVDVQFPERVGIDRLLAALAALEFSTNRPLIVVQAGSAVTVDLVTEARFDSELLTDALARFEGGAIVPGVPMMLRLLGKAADMLPELDAADLIGLPSLPGKNTEEAMKCGAASALVGGVAHLIDRYRDTRGHGTPVILSGGDGMRLSPYLQPPLIVQQHLVHRGLLRLAERQQP